MVLSSRQALTVIEGAEAKARELGLPVVVAVLDAGAHLKALRRMDGAVLASIGIAERKARMAVLFQMNSEAAWEHIGPDGCGNGLDLARGGPAPFGGGVPLKAADGVVIGALGVAGGTSAQDVEVAQAALAAFSALTRAAEPGPPS